MIPAADSQDPTNAKRSALAKLVPLAFLEAWPDPIGVLQHDRFTFVNRAAVHYLGYSSATEIEGLTALEVVSPEDRGISDQRIQSAIRSGAPNPWLRRRLLRRDGTVTECECTSQGFGVGANAAVVVFLRDLSLRRDVQTVLTHTDQVSPLATLAAGIAHEINNPMTFVVTNIEFATEELARLRALIAAASPALKVVPAAQSMLSNQARLEEAETALKDALGGAERVRLIVKNLRSLSHDESVRTQRVDLVAAMEAALEVVGTELHRRAKLVRELSPVPSVQANPAQLTQVFVNLLTNAMQAIEAGAPQHNEVRVRSGMDGQSRVFVEVCDSGAGLSAEVRERMFDLFFTTKEVGVGQGLGLPVSHALIRGMGGELSADANSPRGAVFRVTLPAADSPPKTATAGKRRILIVDDEAGICASLKRILGPAYDIDTETSATAALDRLRGGERFDLILCDLMMPELTGMDLHAKLKVLLPEQADRMIFLTGGAFTSQAREFLETSRNIHVDKPFNKDSLRALVKERLGLGGG